MTKQEFDKLDTCPRLNVSWNGKNYRLVRVSHVTETCYLQPEGRKMHHPYATGYLYVNIICPYQRKSASGKTSSPRQ